VSADQHNDWRAAYQAALLEVDTTKLLGRIEQAYQAIRARMDLMQQSSDLTEYQDLSDALANLRVLRREVLPPSSDRTKFPAPNP